MTILYADRDLLIAEKPAGMPTQPDPSGQMSLLAQLQADHPNVRLTHRLDTPTGGVMAFGLSQKGTAGLSALVQDHEAFCKEYLAVLSTPPATPEGVLEDLLYHDKRQNKAFVVESSRKGAKRASLSYCTLCTAPDGHCLVLVRLHTGRTHQIRVQFASRGLPLCGDGKYGSREKCPFIGLWAHRLTFNHPLTGRPVSATSTPPITDAPWSIFASYLANKETE